MASFDFHSTDEVRFANWLMAHNFGFSHPAIALKTKSGQQYTADFYVPELWAFIEIKPYVYWHEIDRVREISQQIADEGNERLRIICIEMGVKDAFIHEVLRPIPKKPIDPTAGEQETLLYLESKRRESRIVPPKF